jgi:hypothetical protein
MPGSVSRRNRVNTAARRRITARKSEEAKKRDEITREFHETGFGRLRNTIKNQGKGKGAMWLKNALSAVDQMEAPVKSAERKKKAAIIITNALAGYDPKGKKHSLPKRRAHTRRKAITEANKGTKNMLNKIRKEFGKNSA